MEASVVALSCGPLSGVFLNIYQHLGFDEQSSIWSQPDQGRDYFSFSEQVNELQKMKYRNYSVWSVKGKEEVAVTISDGPDCLQREEIDRDAQHQPGDVYFDWSSRDTSLTKVRPLKHPTLQLN